MYWRIVSREAVEATSASETAWEGRFVLHAHRDAQGPHLDLRLDCGDFLLGYRVAGERLAVDAWATEKAPHPRRWLTQDGPAERRDAGRYAWLRRSEDDVLLRLGGEHGVEDLALRRDAVLSPGISAQLWDWLEGKALSESELAALAADGLTARQTAMRRVLGLGRLLDGEAFDAETQEAQMRGQDLESLLVWQRHLEARFDARYTPKPYARAATLPSEAKTTPEREDAPWELLLGEKAGAAP